MLEHIAINALLILFVYGITQDGMPFHFVRRWLDRLFIDGSGTARKVYYPILYCVYCMSSLWGLAYYGLMVYEGGLPIGHLALHLACVFALVGWMYDVQDCEYVE